MIKDVKQTHKIMIVIKKMGNGTNLKTYGI